MKKVCFTIVLLLNVFGSPARNFPWNDEAFGPRERARALVAALTLDEKIGQMMNAAPAIPRFGIPAYNWWNECLHGVARAGLATVYPQAIGLAATFDAPAVRRTASIISDEARAKHHEFTRNGSYGIYQGLTFWTPNVNIFRDPRWGRGQETYGEDPYLTGIIGTEFVRGLQGDHPDYYKVIATAKHYAVHSGPEYERHVFDVSASEFDLWDTYMPAFRKLVMDADVASVMCAYNRLDGEPCCGSENLQVRILRRDWGFGGYIVSDCGAIDDFYKTHKTSPDAATASAQAVLAGTDLECGNSYKALKDAVEHGYITERDIDESLCRLFEARIRLGMFDEPGLDPYENIPYSVVDSPEHRAHAIEMARKSAVLLKNDGGTLPLAKNIKKILVIGPAAEDSISLRGNYNGTPGATTTILQGIREKCGRGTEVKYIKGINYIDDRIFVAEDISRLITNGGQKGFTAEYFGNIKLEGEPILVRNEQRINFRGGVDDFIAPGIKALWMSARWNGTFVSPETREYTFSVSGDDGFRLFVNGEKVFDHFSYHEEMNDIYTFTAEQGRKYDIVLEYFQGDQGAVICFDAGKIYEADHDAILKEAAAVDAVIFAGGISPSFEGEEMPVDLPGFFRGDRTTIDLPEIQQQMLKTLSLSGKPVIFVMQTGSALAFDPAHTDAVLNIWYGGQAAGEAVADILFGDYNPAGRLPVTFYRSDADLPDYGDYRMQGRTYRYFDREPLFPFGHGLSYSRFEYSGPVVQAQAATGESINVSVTVTNRGKYDGEEVVQLYLIRDTPGFTNAICELKGFERIALSRGESREVEFELTPEELCRIGGEGKRILIPEEITVFAGGGQPAFAADGVQGTVRITGQRIELPR